jgi:hypothetical protein
MDSSSNRFAGFTEEEWRAAFALSGMAKHQAYAFANSLFRDLERSPSNGYSISPGIWALLALGSPSGMERVRQQLSESPPRLWKEVEKLLLELSG